jgi:uncharacterized DUF497 family protein
VDFEWDPLKDASNRRKHGVSFPEARRAFVDPRRLVALDIRHSTATEKRYFCFGRVAERVLPVRFAMRRGKVRIIGAGY